jgi:dipeptidyl aminopeptidase/acylaminoacyl peptidase
VKRLVALAFFLVLTLPEAAATPRILPFQDAWPTWSPSGDAIAFTRIHQAGNLMELELVDLRTHRVRKLAQSLGQLQPSWSRDGTRIAYQAGGSIYLTDRAGAKHRIGPGSAPAYGPGSSLARTIGGDLLVGSSTLAGNVIGRPAWSPDGGTLAFRRTGGIYTTDCCIPGTTTLLVGAANPGDPVYSPDGSQLAFTIGAEVWVASRGLVPAHAIARAKPNAGTPSWSPSGDAVVYGWRGGVTRTTLAGHSTLLHTKTGLGAAYSSTGALAYAAPRRACPGHMAIVAGTTVITGTCTVTGTARADVIEGSPREGDVILAGSGNDQVHANDGHTDRVSCGAGRDTVWADRTDRLSGCETVHR